MPRCSCLVAKLSTIRRSSNYVRSTCWSQIRIHRHMMHFFSTREFIPSKYTSPKEIQKDRFEFSAQGLMFRETEIRQCKDIDATDQISYLQLNFGSDFAQTMQDITMHIKENLENTFNIVRNPNVTLTTEDYNDPTTKTLPLYIQPRSFEAMSSICIFYGSTVLKNLPAEELEEWYEKVVNRLYESGFVPDNVKLVLNDDESTLHPDDYSITLTKENKRNFTYKKPHRQVVQTFPSATHHLLICNLTASMAIYRLYEDLQIISNHTTGLRNTIVHRNNGQLRKRSRRPVWIPQIVLADIVNGMKGCKREERTLRNMCSTLESQLDDEMVEKLNFQPHSISMNGYRPTSNNIDMKWDFTLEQLVKLRPPVEPDYIDRFWWDKELNFKTKTNKNE